jgi:hypothetical protein
MAWGEGNDLEDEEDSGGIAYQRIKRLLLIRFLIRFFNNKISLNQYSPDSRSDTHTFIFYALIPPGFDEKSTNSRVLVVTASLLKRRRSSRSPAKTLPAEFASKIRVKRS